MGVGRTLVQISNLSERVKNGRNYLPFHFRRGHHGTRWGGTAPSAGRRSLNVFAVKAAGSGPATGVFFDWVHGTALFTINHSADPRERSCHAQDPCPSSLVVRHGIFLTHLSRPPAFSFCCSGSPRPVSVAAGDDLWLPLIFQFLYRYRLTI